MPMPRNKDPDKKCVVCGVVLKRKRFSGRLEDFSAFLKREHCSRSCGNSHKRKLKNRTENPKREGWHRRARKIIDLKKSFCNSCGTGPKKTGSKITGLLIHHINSDFRDNRTKNLQVLCFSCHSFWHRIHRKLGIELKQKMPQLIKTPGFRSKRSLPGKPSRKRM